MRSLSLLSAVFKHLLLRLRFINDQIIEDEAICNP